MGNSQKVNSVGNKFDDDNNFHKLELTGHTSKIFSIDMHRSEPDKIIISTLSKDGKVLLYEFKDKVIENYASKKKAKTIRVNKSTVIPVGTSYNMTVAITYNETLKSVLIAHGGLDNLCRIRKIDDIHTVDEIALSQGYTAEIMFIHDNSNRVIFGSGDSNVYIYNYILKTHLLTIDAPKGDVVDIDYFIDDILNLLIIGISSCDGYFYIVSIDNKKMEIINIDSIQISMADINCIAFSPNQQYIACDGDDGICTILRRNDKKNKY
eukprot:299828_1